MGSVWNVSTSRFNLSGFVGSLLFCPRFARIFTVVDQRLEPGGFGACPAQIPGPDIPDGRANRFAEQTRLEDAGSCTCGRDAKSGAGCFRIRRVGAEVRDGHLLQVAMRPTLKSLDIRST